MKVKELISALSAYDGEMEVLLEDLFYQLLPFHGISEDYIKDGIVSLIVKQAFPEEWFYEDEEGSRWEKELER